MASRDIFSKALPNIKLSTRFDADGKEIQVERREDKEQNIKEQEIFDILVAAGYFRARIKGLSPFDKIVGGMTWCIVSCDYDVDADLLFYENLTIGQKIALTEKIVSALPKMKCPFYIEPHQIQGLDFIHIFPVIQWLVKKSVENRCEKAEKLKAFALGQFHNHFSLKSDRDQREKYINAINCVKETQDFYRPRRKYKRKDTGAEDEKTRVRITLLEYGDKGNQTFSNSNKIMSTTKITSEEIDIERTVPVEVDPNEIDVDQLLKNLYVANEEDYNTELTDTDKKAMSKHLIELKKEMLFDTKHFSEQGKVKTLLVAKTALEKKLIKIQDDNRAMDRTLNEQKEAIEQILVESEEIKADITKFDSIVIKNEDKSMHQKIEELVVKNEELRQYETKFKEQCRHALNKLQQEINEFELPSPEEELHEIKHTLEIEKERLQMIRLKLAKKNRATVTIERQLDSIPDRTELSQYQRRFLELYNQVSAKHRETKQFYTLYNTLEDTKQYLTKELSLLNSIYENYGDGMLNLHAKDQFVKQLEDIVDGVKQMKNKVKLKCEEEKIKRDVLNAQLLQLVEQQRKYVAIMKQFIKECERNENLMREWKNLLK